MEYVDNKYENNRAQYCAKDEIDVIFGGISCLINHCTEVEVLIKLNGENYQLFFSTENSILWSYWFYSK